MQKFKSEFLYDGESLKSGIEEKKYFDDSIYIGMIKNGKREGKGLYTYKHGDYYFGSWKDDMFDGTGYYIFQRGERYEGQLK